MPTGTVQLHRVLQTTPEKLYRAFTEGPALAKWIPPYGFTCTVHELDARAGGRFRMSFENFSTGHRHAFGGEYLQLVPGEFIQYTDRFDDPGLAGELRVSVWLKAVSCGTGLRIEQTGIPEAIPVEQCYLGWQQSLQQLANLVEPDIPN